MPTVGIVDVDFVKDGGKDWSDWVSALKIPGGLRGGLGQQRGDIKKLLEGSGKDMKRDGGIDVLDGTGREAADNFFDTLDKYGLFCVRRGELENWLKELGVTGRKTDWVVAMLDAMGSDPSDPSYVRPSSGDVWEFMERICSWIRAC